MMADGERGERGLTGDTGQKGTTGTRGVQGEHGQPGRAGPSGSGGERGVQGDHGQHGDTGDTGAAGAAGVAGAVGAGGPRGPRGLPVSRWSQLAMYALVIAAAMFSVLQSRAAQHDAERATVAAQKATAAAQIQALASCIRANIDAARVIAAQNYRPPGETDKQHAARPLIARNLYPILDCKRSQLAQRLLPIDSVQTAKYVRIVTIDGRAPVVANGKVIGSRDSMLDGVVTFGQAGKLP